MILIISCLILIACVAAIVSGVWVIVGLAMELISGSNTPDISPDPGHDPTGNPQKKQNSSELM